MPFNGVFLILAIGSLASLISFLYYNWHPSKMYMGDNGSQFLGALLAIIGIQVFWNSPNTTSHPTLYPFMLILMAFIIPISDTTTVTINRLMRGQSPFVGGRDHTTHHLSYFGLKERTIAWTLMLTNLFFVGLTIAIIFFSDKSPIPIWIIGSLALLVLVTLYTITKISKPKK
jgi:UDP-GlcNAc:undecaprenyl-phosphate GlcNAc-1-phosphate transferase